MPNTCWGVYNSVTSFSFCNILIWNKELQIARRILTVLNVLANRKLTVERNCKWTQCVECSNANIETGKCLGAYNVSGLTRGQCLGAYNKGTQWSEVGEEWLTAGGRMDPPTPTLFALLITPVTIPQYHNTTITAQYPRGHQVEYSVNSKSQGKKPKSPSQSQLAH